MKYMMIVKANKGSETGRNYEMGAPPDPKLMEAIGKHAEEITKAGVLLELEGCRRAQRGLGSVRLEAG